MFMYFAILFSIIGSRRTSNRRYNVHYEFTLHLDQLVKFRFDLNVNFRILEMNQTDLPKRFLAQFFYRKMQGYTLARQIPNAWL